MTTPDLTDAECNKKLRGLWRKWVPITAVTSAQVFTPWERYICRAAFAAGAASVVHTLVFTAPEAVALLETFGGEAGEVTVRRLPEGVMRDDPDDPIDEGPSPAGLWAYMTEYPEEGSVWLGAADPDASPTAQPAATGGSDE